MAYSQMWQKIFRGKREYIGGDEGEGFFMIMRVVCRGKEDLERLCSYFPPYVIIWEIKEGGIKPVNGQETKEV